MFKVLFIFSWFVLHPVHVSLTSIDFIPDPGYFSVFIRMYFDDFLSDSRLNGQNLQDTDFDADASESRSKMEKYLKEKMIIKVNKKTLEGKIREMSLVDNEISINLEYYGGKSPDMIVVKNLIMTDLYADQSNMVIVKVNDFEEGVKLTSDVTEQIFIIKE